MTRRSIELIGTFEELVFEGEAIKIYSFNDLAFGGYPVGLKSKRSFYNEIELGVLYKIYADVRGHNNAIDKTKIKLKNTLDVYFIEKLIPIEED